MRDPEQSFLRLSLIDWRRRGISNAVEVALEFVAHERGSGDAKPSSMAAQSVCGLSRMTSYSLPLSGSRRQ